MKRSVPVMMVLALIASFFAVPSASAATIGQTTIGTSTEVLNTNFQLAGLVNNPTATNLSAANVYLDGKAATSGSAQVRVHVYGGGTTKPVELLGSSPVQTITAGRAAGWQAFTLPNIAIGANWDVWLSVQSTGTTVARLYKTSTGGVGAWGEAGNISTPPDPFYNPRVTTNNYSMNFTTGSGTTPANPTTMPTTAKSGWKYSYGENFDRAAPLGQFESVYGHDWNGLWCVDCDTSANQVPRQRPVGQGGSYRPDLSLSVANSLFNIKVGYDAATGQYIGANPYPQPPPGVNGGSQEYTNGMRTSIRFKADKAMPGWKTAWMLWSSTYAWNDGEIDFPEGDLGGTIHGFSHEAGPNPGRNTLAAPTNAVYTDWHVATTEWIPRTATSTGSVEFFLDGVSIGKTTDSVPSKPMHWNLQTETNLSAVPPAQSVNGNISIDWLTVETK